MIVTENHTEGIYITVALNIYISV